jgi:hypothetical protein
VAERHAILHKGAARIGPARAHPLGHCCNATPGSVAIEGQLTANTAHFLFPESRPSFGAQLARPQ